MTAGNLLKRFWYARVPALQSVPPPLRLALFALLSGCAILIALQIEPSSSAWRFLTLSLFVACACLAIPFVIEICEKILRLWGTRLDHFAFREHGNLKSWFESELAFFSGSVPMYVTGLAYCALGVAALYDSNQATGPESHQYPYYAIAFSYLLAIIGNFLAGAGLYLVCCASRAVWRLGTIGVTRVEVTPHQFGILSTGRTLLRVWFVISLVWMLFQFGSYFGHSGDFLDWLVSGPALLLAAPTAPLIIGSFVICQIPLHKRMVEFKRNEVVRVEGLIRDTSPPNVEELTSEIRGRIEFLEQQRARLLALPEWPFRTRTFMGTIGSTVIATLPVAISLTREAIELFRNGGAT